MLSVPRDSHIIRESGILGPSNLKWKKVEFNRRKLVHQIDKIDNFQGQPAPILRFRSSMQGPCHGELFAKFIMDLDQREKWDAQIDQVYEIHPLRDLDSANIAMGFGKYGDCVRAGIGYCKTKANLGISPREQLTLCGIQNFDCGSSIVWGVEMEESHNDLFPEGERTTRAKSHLFSTTLTPTGPNSFDVEYVLQLEIGGNLPTWLTTPIMYDTIKKLFRTADGVFRGNCETLETFIKEKETKESELLLPSYQSDSVVSDEVVEPSTPARGISAKILRLVRPRSRSGKHQQSIKP